MGSKGYLTSFGLMIFLVVAFNNCSNVELHRIEKPIALKSNGSLCTRLPQELNTKTKFMFVIDKSGSNDDTDNGAVLRSSSIQTFYDQNKTNPDVEWSMIVFNGDEALGYITDPNQVPIFTTSEPDFQGAIDRLVADPDNGSTPYGSALAMTSAAIENDMELYPDDENVYIVFFLSDGEPTDIDQAAILASMVEDVINNNLGNIYLSTAYYGPNGAEAENRLQEMATAGEGKYVNFNNGQNWSFNDLIVKPSVEPWLIKNFLVYNVNAGFCLDGLVGTDSDADGLCDRDEIELSDEGFDPQKRFSFDDGFGDYFHWREVAFGESLPNCTDREDEDFDLLTTCEERYVKNQNPPEGIPQRAEKLNPDSDFDGYLDGIETFVYFTRSLAFALDPFNTSKNIWDGEAEDAGTQIAQHRNPLIRDENAPKYDTVFSPVGINDLGQSCYSFSQTNLSVYETLEVKEEDTLPGLGHGPGENVVYVHFIQTPQTDPNGPGVLMHSFQKLQYDKADPESLQGLSVNDESFKDYVVPKSVLQDNSSPIN